MKTVSIRAFERRINRKLAHEGQQLRKTHPGTNEARAFGNYYIVDLNTNALVCDDVPLGELGYELRVLAADERVQS